MSNVVDLNQEDTESSSIKCLDMMLDYVIVEGAELRRPMFVWLVRLAQFELMNRTVHDQEDMDFI